MLISFLSPFLFFAPEVHLRDMEELWTDEIIIVTAWKDFMTKLLDEWNGMILWVRLHSSSEDLKPYTHMTYPCSRP